ncbi:IS110 family transposase [Amycolatopsis sp. NBC_01488]|uniref:IS110 family transposase n=1 Tax=Amycolatopsis sp. NBC_01488 TaxID=2903563 RepID=UPI002E2C4BA2|nr:IS110 family transposase [Amycolatopsis sp. NBC_01488]
MSTMTNLGTHVTVGVDTHLDRHVAVALDQVGRVLAQESFTADPSGYRSLLRWSRALGQVHAFGIEGTGCYGAGLARAARQAGHQVIEVDRPDRRTRRARGKSDPVDAEAAARAVLAGTATGVPKSRDGDVEPIRALRVARRGAVRIRIQVANQLHALVISAPELLRENLRRLSTRDLVATAAALRPGSGLGPTAATKHAVKILARRHQDVDRDIAVLDELLQQLVPQICPQLLGLFGVGTDTAGALLVTAGDNPDRLHSDPAFANLGGVAPLPASSGKTTDRHRLNRGGDRQAMQPSTGSSSADCVTPRQPAPMPHAAPQKD